MDRNSTNLAPTYPGSLAVPGAAGYPQRGEGLLDVLDRVLDKGVVIAGDIRINLLDIELLTIKIRLLISSADKAKEMGIDWWSRDPHLSSNAKKESGKSLDGGHDAQENKALRDRVERLESQLKALTSGNGAGAGAGGRRSEQPAKR